MKKKTVLVTVDELMLTLDEQTAIRSLKRLAKKWPKTLTLFSWSGSLCVFKLDGKRTLSEATVTKIFGIPNDGGDPNETDVIG